MTEANPIQLRTVAQLAVNVHDLGRAVEFYRDTLGVEFLFEAPPKMAFFNCDGLRLMLSLPETPEYDHPSSLIYFRVADMAEAYAELVERGVTFVGEPHLVHKTETQELWMTFFRDSEGNPLALMSD